jgi:hypothetical protein
MEPPASVVSQMALLTVIMKRGFDDDRVVVRIDGHVVFDRDHLRVRRQIDRAGAFDHEVPLGRVAVEIDVPRRGLAASRAVEMRGPMTLIVSIVNGRLEIAEQQGPAGDA